MPEFFFFFYLFFLVVFYNRNRNLGLDMKRQENNIAPTIKVSVSGLLQQRLSSTVMHISAVDSEFGNRREC